DFDGLTSFGFNLWAIFPDNVALGIEFQQMTIAAASKKVTICHLPPGNPGNARTISVSVNALPAHLAHGDSIGPCEPPLGRCCQGGFAGVVCLVNTEAECMSSGQFISWEEGLDCPDGDATCEDDGNPACGPGAGDCCASNGTPGCDDEDCCNLVCDLDPFCCETSWDGICADHAVDLCGICP
ncbi:MAG: hypothetical protein ACYTGF_05810, partial [Planctomycetota bacterium]